MTFSIFPRTVYKTKTKISGEVEVKEQLGEYALYVQGLIQSGGIVKGIWKRALRRQVAAQGKLSISKCLVLGLGGGTVIQLIKSRYPEAKIVGVEIDPEIVKIGKRFFGLDEIKNLKIIKTDAFEWVKNCSNDLNHDNKKFDLIIVDLYLGDKFPKKAYSDEFLKNIKRFLSKKGVVIFNRLKTRGLDAFEEKLKRYFSQTSLVRTPSNLFFFARG